MNSIIRRITAFGVGKSAGDLEARGAPYVCDDAFRRTSLV